MTDMENLVDKVNQWADESIDYLLSLPPANTETKRERQSRIDGFHWTKQNLERLAKEVLAE